MKRRLAYDLLKQGRMSKRWLLPLALSVFGTACAPDTGGEILGVSCEGKCDGTGDHLRSLWRDPRKLDLGDLLSLGAGFASDALNNALSSLPFVDIQLEAPRLFALPEVAQGDLTIGNLDTLVSGLASRYGERELSTRVNALRADHLRSSSDQIYAESAFRVALGADYRSKAPGFGESAVDLGFSAGVSVEARVIGAYGSEWRGTIGSPLAALKASRGFIFPASLGQIRQLKTGESFALHGEGHLGANLGVGTPILIAGAGPIQYSLVLSAGLRTWLEGTLDVQLVRLDGDQVVVDIGMQKARARSATLALDSRWGVDGLLETHVSLGGIGVDLGKLVENALVNQLNRKLNIIHGQVSTQSADSRVSIVRLRFALDAGDPAVLEPALAQALKGDVRLAQALANRGEPGVTCEFDLLRSGHSSASYAGIDIFGMSFFRKKIESEGSVVIQTPGGALSLMFESLHRESGWFFTSHGYTRVGLSGLSFAADHPGNPRGEANLFLQIQEGDKFMQRDKLLDHLDGVIVGLAGEDTLHAIEVPGNQLERYVAQHCESDDPYDACFTDILSDPTVQSLRQSGHQAAVDAASRLEPAAGELLLAAADLRLAAQASYEFPALLTGPKTSIVMDYRLDDHALSALMQEDGGKLAAAVGRFIGAAGVDREDEPGALDSDRAGILADAQATLTELGRAWDETRADYQKLLGVEDAVIETLGPIGPRAVEIRLPVDSQNRPKYEDAVAQSLAEARSRLMTRLVDDLMALARRLGPHAEATVAYALLGLLGDDRTELRMTLDFDVNGGSWDYYRAAGYADKDVYARGSNVMRIDGGLFDIDALINLQ